MSVCRGWFEICLCGSQLTRHMVLLVYGCHKSIVHVALSGRSQVPGGAVMEHRVPLTGKPAGPRPFISTSGSSFPYQVLYNLLSSHLSVQANGC